MLQTFHGYPSKAMGVMAWEAKSHPRSLVERQLRRTSGTWDLLLTPHPAMDVHYREQYRYAGPIHNAGYPRDDVLVGPDANRLREETRLRLGIGDRTAVLYAPTWRDDLTTNFRAAHLPSTFDVEGAFKRDRFEAVFKLGKTRATGGPSAGHSARQPFSTEVPS